MSALILVAVSGCDQESEARRVWRPEDHGQPVQADPSRVPSGSQGAGQAPPGKGTEREAAAALWKLMCAKCHGPTGRGDGKAAPPGVEVADLTRPAWQQSHTDAQIMNAIAKGPGAMPAFAEKLNQPGLKALTRHVRRLSQAEAALDGGVD